jgi:hypothetical protein
MQDDDGDGTCAPICAEAPWWSAEYSYRVAFTVTNPVSDGFVAGDVGSIVIDHAAWVDDERMLADGNDVRVLFYDGASYTELGRALAPANEWNEDDTEIFFELAQDLAGDTTVTGYWLYFGNERAAVPVRYSFPVSAWAAYCPSNPAMTLACDRRHGTLYSLQLREVSVDTFEVHIFDHTYDDNAYATLRITNDDTDAIIFEKTYGSVGNYDNPGTADELITFTDTAFTVFIVSREWSFSRRYFGCTEFYGDGSNEFSFVVPPMPTGALCGI